MKKLVVILICTLLTMQMTSCGSNRLRTHISTEDTLATEVISDKENGFELGGTDEANIENDDLYLNCTAEQLLEKINEKLKEYDQEELKLSKYGEDRTDYTLDGETKMAFFKKGPVWKYDVTTKERTKEEEEYCESFTVSLSAKSESDAQLNGLYLKIIVGIFSPGTYDDVSKLLHFFEETPNEDKNKNIVALCGNTWYEMAPLGGALYVKPINPKIYKSSLDYVSN